MERVAFLIERTGERLGCLLNPESVVVRRVSGIRRRRLPAAHVTGADLADDPLLFTGGGQTVIDLDLLFDVGVAGSSITSQDVRDLTRPLWALSENAHGQDGYGRPPLARLIWGKAWNIPVVVLAVSERLEYFTAEGAPRRSWLRIRLARVSEPPQTAPTRTPRAVDSLAAGLALDGTGVQVHELIGGGPTLDELEAQILPGLSLEARDLDGVTSSSDIVSEALEETGAWSALLAARDTIGSALEGLSAALSGEGEAGDEEERTSPPPAVQEGAASIAVAMESVFDAVKGEVIGAMVDAASTISAAADDMAQALDEMTEEARAAIEPHLAAALERIRPAVEAIRSAAQRTATAVRARAAMVIGAASDTMERALSAAEEVAGDLVTGASRLGDEALDMIQSSLEAARGTLREMQTTGDLAIADRIPVAMEGLVASLDTVWAAGRVRAATAIEEAVSALSIGLRNVWSASEAIASTLSTKAAEMVGSALDAIRSALAEGEAPTAQSEIKRQLTVVERALGSVLAEPALTDTLAEIKASQQAVAEAVHEWVADADAAAPAAAETARGAIEAAADRIAAALQDMLARDQEALREQARTAMAPHPRVVPAGLAAVTAPSPGVRAIEAGPGERLDHLALQYYGDAGLWRVIAAANDLTDPLRIPSGMMVRIPPISAWRARVR